jgi:hypothetical protein
MLQNILTISFMVAAVFPALGSGLNQQLGTDLLVPAKNFQIQVEGAPIDLQQFKAVISVSCSYKSGIWWPESKSCGDTSRDLEIQNDGRVHVPAVYKFNHRKGNKSENYDLSVTFHSKAEMNDYIGSLNARGKEALNVYAQLPQELYVMKIEGAKFEPSLEGRPLLCSETSKKNDMTLIASLELQRDKNAPYGFLVLSRVNGLFGYFENREYENNPSLSKRDLAELTELTFPGGYLLSVKKLSSQILTLRISLGEGSAIKKYYQYIANVEANSTTLSQLEGRSLELTPRDP